MQCEICGRETSRLYTIYVEGAILRVCRSCSRLGKRVSPKARSQYKNKRKEIKDIKKMPKVSKAVERKIKDVSELQLVENYGEILKKEREKRLLKIEDIAKLINEKESLIHKLENEKATGPIPVIRKLERLYGIKLLVKPGEKAKKEKNIPQQQKKKEKLVEKPKKQVMPTEPLTIADAFDLLVKKK